MPRKGKKSVEKILKCEHCDYTTPRKAFMQDHARIHSGERPYKCDTCGKGFTQKSNLTKHLIVHGEGYKTSYKCDRCDFTTMYKQSLKMHMNWHNGVKPYKCSVCAREFSQSTHRRTHMKEAHGDERKFQCHLCSKCFKRKEHLDKHIVFHSNERNYECEICSKKFYEPKHVSIHMLVHTGDETKVHQCDLCDYKSRYKQGLEVHYRIHLGLRPYRCEECPKAFRTSQTLKIHSRMVHQGMMGKIFNCADCDYSTANKQTLKQHIDHIHMGIKKKTPRMACEYCGKSYSTKSSLHGHKRKKHPIKLRQEMQVRIQKRLVDMKRVGGEVASGMAGTIDDYRYRSSLHAAVAKAMEKARRKNVKASPKFPTAVKKMVSPKKEVTSPQKSPKKEIATPDKSPLKIKVSDFLKKNKGSRFISRRSLAKELQISESECLEAKTSVSEEAGEAASKLSYMSTLGLLQMSPSSETHQHDVQTDSSQDTVNEAAGSQKGPDESQGVLERNQGDQSEQCMQEDDHTIREMPKRKSKESEKKTSAKRKTGSESFVDAAGVQSSDVTGKSVALKRSPKLPKRQQSPVCGKRRNSPKNTAAVSKSKDIPTTSQPRGKRGKSIAQIADTLAAQKLQPTETCASKPVIEYEPLAVPSLGPWEESYEPLDLSIQTLGSVTSAVPGYGDGVGTSVAGGFCVQTPLATSMTTYDSLRDLACVYMNNERKIFAD